MAMPTIAPTPARWLISERDRDSEAVLQRELGVSALVAAVLAQRGLTEPRAAEIFLRCSIDDLEDSRLLPDYEAAKGAILGARERGDLIYVHGDYDVDGVTSAALFDRFLKKIGCNVVTHVPHRMKEGYGIHKSAVQAAIDHGAKLFLTCDCGIGAHAQVDQAREAGMVVVVTDHHTVGAELPNAHAVVNPHRQDSKYPFAELSGVGVVFKLCAGLAQELGLKLEHFNRAYLDLAALGTIADVMPLVGENRILAKHGLEKIRETKKVGLLALMAKAEVSTLSPVTPYHVSFVLGPRLNAAGRVDDAGLSLQLLLETDPEEAGRIAASIEESNEARRSEQGRILLEAIELVETRKAHEKFVIVVAKEGWHSGVVGIVASRLAETYCRPTFVLCCDSSTGIAHGSARSYAGFHLANAIRAHPNLFLTGGGHAAAAGCSIEYARMDEICEALHTFAAKTLKPEDFVPTVRADMEVDSSEITLQSVEELMALAPFGMANQEPVFVARQVSVVQLTPTKNPVHVQLSLRQGQGSIAKGIAFNMGERFAASGVGAVVDLMFRANIDEWRGSRSLKWRVQDYIEA